MNAVLEALDRAEARLKESSQIASNRLRAIWNPDTRRYEPHEEMVALHDIINGNLAVWNGLRKARRVYEAQQSEAGAHQEHCTANTCCMKETCS